MTACVWWCRYVSSRRCVRVPGRDQLPHGVRVSAAAPPLNGAGSSLECAFVAAESACAVARGLLLAGLITCPAPLPTTHCSHSLASKLKGRMGTSDLGHKLRSA